MDNTVLSLLSVYKRFGQSCVINDLSMDVFRGEFVTLLGESGCGKTTTLRIIAGLERPDSGHVFLEGVNITDFSPDRRGVNTVFQNYALFPHMNVYNNIAYGPKIRGLSKNEVKKEVTSALSLVKMTGYEKRMPGQLSGGQRQRVAIARALVNKPLLLLLDEPLGALDEKLRRHMQTELKSIQEQAGVTFVYVTHDQDEALSMSDRIGIMHEGRFLQTGTPAEVYERPKSLFVAEFIGERNILPVKILSHTDSFTAAEIAGTGKVLLAKKNTTLREGTAAHAAILADRAHFAEEQGQAHANTMSSKVLGAVYSGSHVTVSLELFGVYPFRLVRYGASAAAPGADVSVAISPEDIVLL